MHIHKVTPTVVARNLEPAGVGKIVRALFLFSKTYTKVTKLKYWNFNMEIAEVRDARDRDNESPLYIVGLAFCLEIDRCTQKGTHPKIAQKFHLLVSYCT